MGLDGVPVVQACQGPGRFLVGHRLECLALHVHLSLGQFQQRVADALVGAVGCRRGLALIRHLGQAAETRLSHHKTC